MFYQEVTPEKVKQQTACSHGGRRRKGKEEEEKEEEKEEEDCTAYSIKACWYNYCTCVY